MLRLEDRIRGYEPFFGKWRLASQNPLGEGTSGIVYPIRYGEYEAALKIIPIPKNDRVLRDIINRSSSEADVRRELEKELGYVKDEIEIMRLLEGESNIVYFNDSEIYRRTDTYGWDVLIIMEKLVRIDSFLRDPRHFGYNFTSNANLVMQIWIEMVTGLCVCEKNNIVHFDIKPENIFYAPGKGHFKLGDFGVAVNTRGRQNVMQGGFVGTRDYASPEMWNRQGGDSRSDIYSLALVIYQLLNNQRLPFVPVNTAVTRDDYVRAFDDRVMKRKPIPAIPGVKREIMNILLKCLEYDPDKRYASFEMLRQDLMSVKYGGKSRENVHSAGRNQPKKKSLVVPIVAVAASLGVAGAMVAIGMTAMNKKDDKQEVVPAITEAVLTATPSPTPYYTEEASQLVTPEVQVTPTPTPEVTQAPGFSAHGNLHNYFDDNNQMLSVLNALVSGEVQFRCLIDGAEVPVNRIGNTSVYDLPGNWSISESAWPEDGLYFIIEAPELYQTHTLSLEVYGANGAVLYSQNMEFHLAEMAGAINFIQQAYIPPIQGVHFENYGFSSVDGGYVGPGQSYAFYGTAEPNSRVEIYLNTPDKRIANVTSDDQGNWSYELNEALIKSSGSSFCLLAGYEGETPVRSAEFIYDNTVSAISVNGAVLADSVTVSGITEGNAGITFAVNGVEAGSGMSRPDGYFEVDISGATMFEGDTYSLTVTDHVGNVGSVSGKVGRRSQFAQIAITSPSAGIYGPMESIEVKGSAEPGEKLTVIAGEVDYKKTVKVGRDGLFEASISLPKNIPPLVNLIVQYENKEEGFTSCLLEYDTVCELSVADTLAVGRADLAISSEPYANVTIEVLNSGGYKLGGENIVCDEYGAYTADLSYLLPLEGDRVIVTAVDAIGNSAQTELTVRENADLLKLMRVDSMERQISAEVINADSYNRDGMRFAFEGYPGCSVILDVRSGDQTVYSCFMSESDGVYTADLQHAGLGSGDYSISVRYEKRPDREYTLDMSLAIEMPEIRLTTDIAEGSRTVSGVTAPESVVSIANADTNAVLASNYSRQNGEFSLTFSPLEAGRYIIQAIDPHGNTGMLEINIAKRVELTIGRADFSDSIITSALTHLDLYGVADPNREIILLINGEDKGISFYSGDNGWNYRLPVDYLPEGSSELSVKYASVEGKPAAMNCVKDTICNLSVNAFNEAAQFVTGTADADAAVSLIVDGMTAANATVSNGQFAVDLAGAVSLPLDINRQLTFRAVDSVGNVSECVMQANKIVRSPISIFLRPEPVNGYINTGKIEIFGKAEPNTEIILTLTAGENSWQYQASAKHGEYILPIELPAEASEGEIRIHAAYADGFSQESSASYAFGIDCLAPVLSHANTFLTGGVQHIYGNSSDNAEVSLYVNGKNAANNVYPNASGAFVFESVELREGDEVCFRSVDAAGNVGESTTIVVSKVSATVACDIRIQQDTYSVGDTIRVEGWLAFDSVQNVPQLRFYSGDSFRGTNLKMNSDLRAMTEDELSNALASLDEPIIASQGYWFTKDVVVDSSWTAGVEYEAAINFAILPEQVAVFCEGAKFTLNASAVNYDVNSFHVGENYAFGVDAQQPRQAYNSGNIVISGWVYADASVSGEIGALTIESVDGSMRPVACEFDGRIADASELGSREGVYYCSRDAQSILPNAADYGLEAVSPTDKNAGFILMLNQDLPDGEYLLTFETTYEGRYEETISTVIRVDNSAADSSVSIANEILQKWTDGIALRDAEPEEE